MSLGGASYFVTLWVYPLRRKDDVLCLFQKFVTRVENQSSNKVRCLHWDNEGEYVSRAFQEFCDSRHKMRIDCSIKPSTKWHYWEDEPYYFWKSMLHAFNAYVQVGRHKTLVWEDHYIYKWDNQEVKVSARPQGLPSFCRWECQRYSFVLASLTS